MKNITKVDIVNDIAYSTGMSKQEIKAVVDGVLLSIISAVAEGKRIELRGFGVFKFKSLKPRTARNPKTGEPVMLDSRYVPLFNAFPDFINRVNEDMLANSNS